MRKIIKYINHKLILISVLLAFPVVFSSAFPENLPKDPKRQVDPPFLSGPTRWADSIFSTLTLDEKIAQLFMVASYSNRGPDHAEEIKKLITDYKIGGITFFQGGPVRQAILTNEFQALSKVPLFISMDAEWGLAMRLDSTLKYPFAMQMGAMDDENLIYEAGRDIARQLKCMGVHINFAPVVDINNNPLNPVISIRSFGQNRTEVTLKALALMLGMQDNKIISVAKHFPGHGDTQTDSHYALPLLTFDRARLDSIELYPFRHLIQAGVSGIMSGHLQIPCLDSTSNLAASLSYPIVTGLLKQKMKFKGLIFTDALTMKGVTDYFKPGDLELKAILAGNDILVKSTDIPAAIDSIKKAIRDSIVPLSLIENSCRKILTAKQWAGLDQYKPVDLAALQKNLNYPGYELMMRKMAEKSLTLAWDPDTLIPFVRLDTLRIASLSCGEDSVNDFFWQSAARYAPVTNFKIPSIASDSIYNETGKKLKDFNLIIAVINSHDIRMAKQFGIDVKLGPFIDSLAKKNNVVLAMFANPYALRFLHEVSRFRAILMAYESNRFTKDYAAQLFFGGIPAQGRLPITINDTLRMGKSRRYSKQIRLKYSIPEELGISIDSLTMIDTLVNEAIQAGAMPGCQILAAWYGIVFYDKPFGYHTYLQEQSVKNTDLYDIASVTKITATLPLIMKLYDQKKLSLDAKLSACLPQVAGTNKADLLVKDMLAHQAGLQSWIPFYLNTLQSLYKDKPVYIKSYSDDYPFRVEKNVYASRNLVLKSQLYKSQPLKGFDVPVAENLFILNSYRDSIWKEIYASPVSKKKSYLYSDLAFLIFQQVIEKLSGQDEPSLINQQFYKPMGMYNTGYKPLERFDKSGIIPTENDVVFRKQLIQGYVHDPAAAMLGGVAGHAGIFSNADDLAKIMQMYLWNGEYGGQRYLSEETVQTFTSCPFCKNGNRRGLGFDKPVTDGTKTGPVCTEASLSSFGHTGFTGTIAWDDPENQFMFIFLSNRVHPDQNNIKLTEMNVRTNIQEVFYKALNTARN